MSERRPTRTEAERQPQRIAVRVPAWMLAALDGEVERLRTSRLGANVSRSDAVREILARALGGRRERA
jgi:hypothetical protein